MYSASIDNNGTSQSDATATNYTFTIDTEGKGANPISTVLAGLCGCIGHWARDYILGEQIGSRGFIVKAEAELTADRQRLSDIAIQIVMKETRLDESQREELLKHVRNCPIHNTLRANGNISIVLAGEPAERP